MSAPKKKLFKPLDLDKRMVGWNNMQPTIYGKKINQYDNKTGKPIGRWGVGEIYGGDTTDLFEIFWDVFIELDYEDLFYHGEEYVFNGIKDRMKGDFMEALQEGGPLEHMYFDLTIPMDGEEVRERFNELLKQESLRESETPKKKLFAPIGLSGEDSRWNMWNKEQPIKDGVQINQYTHDGKETGYWEDYFDDGQLYSKGLYVNGKKDGVWESYWRDGNLMNKGAYKNGKEEGIWVSYYSDGQLHYKGLYKDGNMVEKLPLTESEKPKKKLFAPIGLSGEDSRYAKWNKEQPIVDGKPINQYSDDGKKEGYWEEYRNGYLYSKGLYINDKKEGNWEYYFDNGDLKERVSYKNDKMNGYWEWYYTNGQISASGQYKNGKEDGVFEHYWFDGELYRKELYKDGELVKELPLTESETPKKKLFRPIGLSGEDSRYDKWNKEQPIVDGERINQFNNNGKKEGLWIEYYEGKIESKKEYKNGEVDGIDQSFYDNGQIQFDGHQKNNEFDGLWKMYYRTGELKEIGNYENSYKQGIWKWYYPFENQLETIVKYIDGRPDGLAMEYFANGNIWKKMVYNLGKKIAYIVYDIDGNHSSSMDWNDEYENMIIKEQMENKDKILKSFEPQKELNPKIWDENGKLKKKIKDTLVAIGQEFHKTLEVEAPIDDIIFTGSLANYNWSQYSDVDLHVLMDFNEFDDKELIKKYFDAKKAYWNDNHDIKIKGYDVELYAQDKDEPHESTGIYSVIKDEWVRKPKPQEVKIDRETIKKKVKQFEGEYNRIVQLYNEGKYEETRKALDKIKDKIKKYRKAGLDKGGEMATENLVFKTMRRSGLMDKIYELGLETTDKEYTIETLDENETPKKKRLFAPIGLSGENSRYGIWNKEQPIKDGQPINQYTNDGKKTGYWEDYYKNGELSSKGSYKDGKHDGIWEWYHLNGNLWSKGSYENGESKGIWEEYNYENGKLAGRGEYVNDKRDGIWEYYYSSGEIYSKGEYTNNMKNGIWLFYNPNGRLFSKKLYKNDKILERLPLTEAETPKKKLFRPIGLSGEDNRYDKWNKEQEERFGEKLNQYNIETGNRDGEWIEYYPENSNPMYIGNYENGDMTGHWRHFNPDGTLNREGEYRDGYKVGYWESYWDGYHVKSKGTYNNEGKKDGSWAYYNEDGKLESKGEFKNDEKDGVWEYYTNGEMGYKETFKNGRKLNKFEANITKLLKDFKTNIGLDAGFLTSFGAGINALIRNISSLIKDYSVQPLTAFEITNLAIAMIVVYFRKGKSLKGFKEEMLSIAAFTSLMPAYADIVNSLLGNVDFMEAFMTIIKSAGVYTMLTHFKSK